MPRTPSFWLDELALEPRRPSLQGDQTADVCIVGGGFTGLWTAYELRRADPSREVVVLEAAYAGFGASGRNGGWVSGEVAGSTAAWAARAGGDPGARGAMASAAIETVAAIGEAVQREAIECDWRLGGSLVVAQSTTQAARLREDLISEREWFGADGPHRWLDASELAARLSVRDGRGALFTPHCARVHPGRLVRGLAAAVERAGARVYESTPALALEPGAVRTPAGSVAAPVVLLAIEGYTANLPGAHRRLLPLGSTMVVTEPLPAALWREIGWDGCETLLDGAHAYTYSQRTADGRIAIGGRGVPYHFASRTDREGRVPDTAVHQLHDRLAALFPALRDVGIERAWSGVLGVARDWCPSVVFDRRSGIGWAGGYAGEGVAASHLAAMTLRDLVLGRSDGHAALPWVGTPARDWEPEPLRFLATRGVWSLLRAADRRELAHDVPSRLATLAGWVAGR